MKKYIHMQHNIVRLSVIIIILFDETKSELYTNIFNIFFTI